MSSVEVERGNDAPQPVVRSSPLATVVTDAQRRVVMWSPVAERLLGWPVEEAVGRLVDEIGIIPPDQRDRFRALHRQVVDGDRESVHVETPRCRKDGSRFLATIWMAPLTGPDGNPRGFVESIADITEQHNGEHHQAEQAQQREQARYRDLFEEAPYPYMSVSADGSVHMANRRTEQLLGFGRHELVGTSVLDLSPPDHPDGRPKAHQLFHRFLAGEQLCGEELQMRRADGEPVWISLSASPICDEHGDLIASRTILEDITARKHAQQALTVAHDELQRANVELAHLAYGAAHDLAEPVRTVTAYGQLLARRYHHQLDDHAADALASIVEAGTRLRQLVDGLRAYAHAGHQQADITPIDLGELVDETRHSLAAAIDEADATVIAADPLPTVPGDRAGLAQVLQNLIGNALKHAHPPQPPTVHVAAEPTRDGWRITVTDNGPGIPADQHDCLFDAFQHHDRHSLGIGLTICRKIVEAHGGHIWVEPTTSKGATFAFTIADPLAVAGDPTQRPSP